MRITRLHRKIAGGCKFASREPIPIDMKQIVIYDRIPDGWRIARMIGNPNGE